VRTTRKRVKDKKKKGTARKEKPSNMLHAPMIVQKEMPSVWETKTWEQPVGKRKKTWKTKNKEECRGGVQKDSTKLFVPTESRGERTWGRRGGANKRNPKARQTRVKSWGDGERIQDSAHEEEFVAPLADKRKKGEKVSNGREKENTSQGKTRHPQSGRNFRGANSKAQQRNAEQVTKMVLQNKKTHA